MKRLALLSILSVLALSGLFAIAQAQLGTSDNSTTKKGGEKSSRKKNLLPPPIPLDEEETSNLLKSSPVDDPLQKASTSRFSQSQSRFTNTLRDNNASTAISGATQDPFNRTTPQASGGNSASPIQSTLVPAPAAVIVAEENTSPIGERGFQQNTANQEDPAIRLSRRNPASSRFSSAPGSVEIGSSPVITAEENGPIGSSDSFVGQTANGTFSDSSTINTAQTDDNPPTVNGQGFAVPPVASLTGESPATKAPQTTNAFQNTTGRILSGPSNETPTNRTTGSGLTGNALDSNSGSRFEKSPSNFNSQPNNGLVPRTTPEVPVSAGTGLPGSKNLDGPQTPSLTLEKIAPEEIQIGKPANFKIKIRNTGKAAAHMVVVRDEIPQGTRLLDTNPPATQITRDSVVWRLGTIGAGEEVVATMNLMPEQEGEIGSVATVAFQSQASVRTFATRPKLVITHAAPKKVLIGEDITLMIKISNPGTGATTGIVLDEDVPNGLKHPKGPALEFEVGTLKPGETKELPLTLKAVKPGMIENVIGVSADAGLVSEDRLMIEVIAPQLTVDLAGPRRRFLDRQATYQVTLANPGTASAKEVELVTYLPKGLKFLKSDNEGQYDSQTHAVYWSLEELPARQSGTVELTALPVEMGEQRIRVESRADMELSDVKEQTVKVEGLAKLSFTVADVADPIEIGKETTYEIRIVNQGSKPSSNIRLQALVPIGMQPLTGVGPSKVLVEQQRVYFEPLARLAPKADALYKIRVKGLRGGDQKISVQLLSDEIKDPLTKEVNTHVYAEDQ